MQAVKYACRGKVCEWCVLGSCCEWSMWAVWVALLPGAPSTEPTTQENGRLKDIQLLLGGICYCCSATAPAYIPSCPARQQAAHLWQIFVL